MKIEFTKDSAGNRKGVVASTYAKRHSKEIHTVAMFFAFDEPNCLARLLFWISRMGIADAEDWLLTNYPEIVEELTRIALEDKK